MSAEIYRPFGLSLHSGETIASVVEELEKLLEEARRGEIVGFAMTKIDPTRGAETVISLGIASGHYLVSGLRLAERDLIQAVWPQ